MLELEPKRQKMDREGGVRGCKPLTTILITLWLSMATTSFCVGVEHIPKHIPVVTSVSSRADSLMFERSSVF